jgi:nitroimidazol reductase NimA-like FMN-containing flavoprotein (pyridoxamine 5'-phosphate oxidase superfamily)
MNIADDESESITSIEMNDEETVEFLQNQGHGVLALANHNESYGVPVSFGYTEEEGEAAVYLYLLQFGEASKKLEFAEQTGQACLIVYNVENGDTWRSVIVTGSLTDLEDESGVETVNRITDREYIDNIMGENAWFPVFEELEEPITDTRRFLLNVDEITGRQGEAYQ